MRRVVVSVVPVLAVLASATAPIHADAPLPPDRARTERSKIVRVERPGVSHGTFMFCDVKPSYEGECIAAGEPHAGDRIEVIDDRERVAELRVKGATQRTTRDPSCTIMWDVQFEGDGGTLDGSHGGQLTGLAGVQVERTGHRMNPANGGQLKIPADAPGGSGSEESVMIGVDKNGDGEMDVAVTLFNCADPNATPGKYGSDFCVNIWAIDHGKYKRIQQITAQQLQPCLR